MAIPVWPVTLPQELLIAGYARSAPDNRIESQMDVGPGKIRRRTTSAPSKFSGTLKMDRAKLAIFTQFYSVTTQSGVLRFSWTDPDTGAAVEMRFAEVPSWTKPGLFYDVALSLEILP